MASGPEEEEICQTDDDSKLKTIEDNPDVKRDLKEHEDDKGCKERQ